MNNLSDLFSEMSNFELKVGLEEIREWSKTGILTNGVVRVKAHIISNRISVPNHDALRMSEKLIYQEAANRWYNSLNFIDL